jgi:glycosyltransferase involved in cell wall biosynthesis
VKVDISLIVATVGRVAELERLLASLVMQTSKNFELIVVDQNPDDRLSSHLSGRPLPFPSIVLRSELGASRARNLGIKHAQGDIIGFPDDDCWYPSTMIDSLEAWFTAHPQYDFLSCPALDEHGQDTAGRWPRKSKDIDRKTALRTCACSSLFVRRGAALSVGGFDETMGPGPQTLVKAGEDNDFALRMISKSFRGRFVA